jgi:putative lipoic acid-binding regulatory protein
MGGALNEEEKARALALLAATHQFPVEYPVSVITINEEAVWAELRSVVEEGLPQPLTDDSYERVLSKGARYSSHRFRVSCQAPEDVLALYERLRRVKGVITVM